MVRVTYTVDLPEWWGAEECYEDGGEFAVIELIHEDIVAFLEGGSWSVQKINPLTDTP